MIKRIKELEEENLNSKYVLKHLKYSISNSKTALKYSLIIMSIIIVLSFVLFFYSSSSSFIIWILIFIFGSINLMRFFFYKDSLKHDEKTAKVYEKDIEDVNKWIELEKSYQSTTILRLTSPYSTFKEDIVDNKVIIKEKQGREMIVVDEKTIEECIEEFKELISPFEIVRAQICQRTDYPGKDQFKWEEIKDLKNEI